MPQATRGQWLISPVRCQSGADMPTMTAWWSSWSTRELQPVVPGRAACFLALCVCFIVSFENVSVSVQEFVCSQLWLDLQTAGSSSATSSHITASTGVWREALNLHFSQLALRCFTTNSGFTRGSCCQADCGLCTSGSFQRGLVRKKKQEPEPELKPHYTSSKALSSFRCSTVALITLIQVCNWIPRHLDRTGVHLRLIRFTAIFQVRCMRDLPLLKWPKVDLWEINLESYMTEKWRNSFLGV